ncbi:MAG: DoxX family protein [Aeromonas sp.]|uniref:DoxX family protein n=1 Tax=Aeromonas sp. TaxID=647 RepID=UPI003F2FFBED
MAAGFKHHQKKFIHMVETLLNNINRLLHHEDMGKLLLRLAVGGLMLFHGLHKLIDGVDGISAMLMAKGLPGFIAYGVLLGEVVAPLLIILGILTRPAALVLAFTMVLAWLMVGTAKTWQLDAVGAWAIESLIYFFIRALAVVLLGVGRFSLCWQYQLAIVYLSGIFICTIKQKCQIQPTNNLLNRIITRLK